MAWPELQLGALKVGFSTGSSFKYRPSVLKAAFGNRYVQRAGDGFNKNQRTYEVKFTNLTQAEANAIIQFLENRFGVYPFTVRIPRTTTLFQCTCEVWDRTHEDKAIDSITATFVEDFTAG